MCFAMGSPQPAWMYCSRQSTCCLEPYVRGHAAPTLLLPRPRGHAWIFPLSMDIPNNLAALAETNRESSSLQMTLCYCSNANKLT